MRGIEDFEKLERDKVDGFRCYQRRTGYPIGYTVAGSNGTKYYCGNCVDCDEIINDVSDAYPFELCSDRDFEQFHVECVRCGTPLNDVEPKVALADQIDVPTYRVAREFTVANAAYYCAGCAQPDDNHYPAKFEEVDAPGHCDECDVLIGFKLTEHGINYIVEAVAGKSADDIGEIEAIWLDYYNVHERAN